MGGYGALELALGHPEIFGTVGANSPSLLLQAESPFTLDRPEQFLLYSLLAQVTTLDPARAVRIWIDVGMDDPYTSHVVDFETALTGQGVAVEYHLWPGGHTDEYWASHLTDYLSFYAANFR